MAGEMKKGGVVLPPSFCGPSSARYPSDLFTGIAHIHGRAGVESHTTCGTLWRRERRPVVVHPHFGTNHRGRFILGTQQALAPECVNRNLGYGAKRFLRTGRGRKSYDQHGHRDFDAIHKSPAFQVSKNKTNACSLLRSIRHDMYGIVNMRNTGRAYPANHWVIPLLISCPAPFVALAKQWEKALESLEGRGDIYGR